MAIVTTSSNQKQVLSGIISISQKESAAGIERCKFMASNLRGEHFTEPYEFIYKCLLVYYRSVGVVISYEHFVDICKRRNLDDVMLSLVVALFVEMRDSRIVPETEFRYQVLKLRELTKSDRLTELLTETMDIAHHGKKVGSKTIYGADSAILYAQRGLNSIGRSDSVGTQAVTNKDMSRVLTAYSDRKFGRSKTYATTFNEIDDLTSGGFQPGDLVFLAAYTSEGKTTLLLSLIDHWVYKLKLNVVLATSENPPAVVQRRLVSIRSADPIYGGSINYKRLKEGRLSPDEEKILERIVADMATNTNYGNLAIFQIPSGSTVTSIFDDVRVYNELWPVDIFGWDYIGYTASEVKRGSDREEIGHVVRAAKLNASTFENGRGLAVCSPYQVSRGKWEDAVKKGVYTLACMEESSAAEKAADIVWSVLRMEDKTVSQLLKQRDGPKYMQPFEINYDSSTYRLFARPRSVSI